MEKKKRENRKSLWIGEATSLILLSACMNSDEKTALHDAFDLSPSFMPQTSYAQEAESCFQEEYQQPAAEISRSIDLLFVMDTSGSMDDNRAKVAEGISSFVSELPPEVDYRVGVILAHGSQSSWSGKLFTYNGSTVFDSKIHSIHDIESRLRDMVLHTPIDSGRQQGEEGTYSLIKGLTTHLNFNRGKGFFRTDAALAIVFVSDENDICAPYTTRTDMPGLTSSERSIRTQDCNGGISTDTVVSQVKSIQGNRPYIFGAVTHIQPNYDDRGGNDGYGWGYMEVVQSTQGVSTEINNGDYTQGLSDMGKLATSKLHLILDRELTRTPIDASTLEVRVDGVITEFTYDSQQNEIHLSQGGGALSQVTINYCLQESLPCPSPSPTPTGTPTVNPSTSPTPSPSTNPTPGPSASPTPDPSTSPTPSPTPTCTGLECGVLGI